MKSIKVTNLGEIRNELNKYKKGRKLDIHQFNQVARIAWLGKLVIQPLDPLDAECESLLVYLDYPDDLATNILNIDQELQGRMHIVDGEQGAALIDILQSGFEERAKMYQELSSNDFYFRYFYKDKDKKGDNNTESSDSGSE